MSQSKIPPKVLEAAAKAADGVDIHQPHEDAFLDGVEWLWSHLSEQAPEFDAYAEWLCALDSKYRNLADKNWEYIAGAKAHVISLAGEIVSGVARAAFDQMKAREAALRASGQELTDIYMGLEQKHYLLTKERDELRAELKAVRHEMRMQGGAVERMNAALACQTLAEERALRIAQERDAALAEVERLKRELAEAEEAGFWGRACSRLKAELNAEHGRAAKLLQSGQALVNWAEANHEMPGYSQVISEMRQAIAEYKGDKA